MLGAGGLRLFCNPRAGLSDVAEASAGRMGCYCFSCALQLTTVLPSA